MTSTRPTTDTTPSAPSAAVTLPPVSESPPPNLSIGRSDHAPVDKMVRELGLRSFPPKPALVPVGSGDAPVGSMPASAVITADKAELSLADLAAGNFATTLTTPAAANKPSASVRAEQLLGKRPVAAAPKVDVRAEIEATLVALEDKLAAGRANEQHLRETIAAEKVIIHKAEDELVNIDRDSLSLSVQAREVQARSESAIARSKSAVPGSSEGFAVTNELRELETVRQKIIRVARDLSSGRAQKQSFVAQATLRMQAAEALLASTQPLLVAVDGQIKEARAMLDSQKAQDAVLDGAEIMTSIREKLQDMMQLLGGEQLVGFQSIMEDQAERDVRLRMRESQHNEDAARIIKSVTDKVNAQNDDAFLALCATPLDESVKVSGELRSNVARDSLSRYGLGPQQQPQPEPQPTNEKDNPSN